MSTRCKRPLVYTPHTHSRFSRVAASIRKLSRMSYSLRLDNKPQFQKKKKKKKKKKRLITFKLKLKP